MGPNPIWPVSLLKGKFWTDTHISGGKIIWRHGENVIDKPKSVWGYQKLGDRFERDFPSRNSEDTGPTNTLTWDLKPPELWDNKFLLSKPLR